MILFGPFYVRAQYHFGLLQIESLQKLLQNIFIINSMSYVSFNVHSQAIIHLLIYHLIDLFKKF